MNKAFFYNLALLFSVALSTISQATPEINDTFNFQEYSDESLYTTKVTRTPPACQTINFSDINIETAASVATNAPFTTTIRFTTNCLLTRTTRAVTILPANSVVIYLALFAETKFVSVESTSGDFTASITENSDCRKTIALVNQSALSDEQEVEIKVHFVAPCRNFNLFTNVGIGANPGSDFVTVTPGEARLLTVVGCPKVKCSGSNTATTSVTLMPLN